MRAPLGLKRTVEVGKVKQSFSHGRSNTVIVETKKARTLRRPGEPAPEAHEPEPVAAPPPRGPPRGPPPPPPRPSPARRSRLPPPPPSPPIARSTARRRARSFRR